MSKNTLSKTDELIASVSRMMAQSRALRKLESLLRIVGAVALILTIALAFAGAMVGPIVFCGVVALTGIAGSLLLGRFAARIELRIARIREMVARAEAAKKSPSPPVAATKKIPLSIGFANFSGDDLAPLVEADVASLGPLFARARTAPAHQLPTAEVLFMYMHLNEDGTIKGSPQSGIRQIVQLAKPAILVVASPNPATHVQKAMLLDGPRSANIVITLARKGDGFGRFFKTLFTRMRDGEDMMTAWVRIAPQGPQSDPAAPAVILAAEAGKLVFPR